MAGAIEQGFNEEPDDSDKPTFTPIMVKTDALDVETIGMYQMPGFAVLDVITTPGLAQLPKMVDLFRLAINDPAKANDLGILTFEELTEAVSQWVLKSKLPIPSLDFGQQEH